MSFLNPEKEIMIMNDYKTSCMVSTPSHALHLAGLLRDLGIDANRLSLGKAILVSEPMSPQVRSRIEEGLGVTVSSGYGVPEVMGPGIAYECVEGRLHLAEDHFIAEIIDPQTGLPVEDGREGELVVTTITTKAYPLIRFRTGDITRLMADDTCPCGRTLRALEAPTRRADDALSIRGVRIYPSQIERIITTALGETPPYAVVLYKVKELDELDILIEEVESLFSDEIKILERMIAKIRDDLWEILGIRANIKLVEHVTMKEVKGESRVIIRNHTMKE
jgi:phenylacetate-CoA ligase